MTQVEEVVSVGSKVWVKVVEVEDTRVSLSMKHVDQASGRDLDYDGFEYAREVRLDTCCLSVWVWVWRCVCVGGGGVSQWVGRDS